MLREAMLPVLGGAAIGLAVAVGAARLAARQLFGLTANDPVTISVAVLVMIAQLRIGAGDEVVRLLVHSWHSTFPHKRRAHFGMNRAEGGRG